MDCVNCDCTVKTMDNLEMAIQKLMQRGKHVNRMMDNEKLIRQAKRMEEVEQLKKQMPKATPPLPQQSMTMDSTMKNSENVEPRRTIYNKQLKTAETIDFDIPSLAYESSENGVDDNSVRYTSTSLTIPTKTCPSSMYTKSEETTTVTTEMTHSTFKKSKSGAKNDVAPPSVQGGGAVAFNSQYIVDNDGNLNALPMKVYIKQNLVDSSLDIQFVFFDGSSNKVMDISMTMDGKKIRNVEFCGKCAKLD